MKGFWFRRPFGRLLQGAGLSLAVLATAGLLATPKVLAQLASVVAQVKAVPAPNPNATDVPAPSAEPIVKATPTPAPRLSRGGPLEFSLSGSLQFGKQTSSTTLSGLAGLPTSYSNNQSTAGAGLLGQLTRRTATTSLSLQLPLNLALHTSQAGYPLVLYSTPHYTLGYGSQSLGVLGQLSIGGTPRAFSLAIPTSGGDITFFGGPAIGPSYSSVRLLGVRERRLAARRLYEFGIFHSMAAEQAGAATTLFSGIAATWGKTTLISELGLQEVSPSGIDPGSHGIAFQSRIDRGTPAATWSLTLRGLPERFLSYGAGEVYGDKLVDLSFIGSGAKRNYNFDAAFERSSLNGQETNQRRTLLGVGGQIGSAIYAINLQDQELGGSSPTQWSGSVGGQLSLFGHGGGITVGTQVQRLTQANALPSSSLTRSIQLQRTLGTYFFQLGDQDQRTSGGYVGISHYGTLLGQIGRTFGRTSFSLSYALTHTQTPISDAIQRTPLINLTRQISPVISITTSYGTQSLNDRLNPASDGRSRIFNFQINAPFSFGNAVVQGRIDPRLPATIIGRVATDPGQNAAFAGLASSGVGNALVILDGRTIQRTDLNGNFQFSFVTPGQHQVRVESASLPHGLIADQPVITLNLQGGQEGQANFLIGNFGGIQGHVYGLDSSGARVGLQNVLLRVDGTAYSQTDQDGAYGFGRLQPGAHTVTVVESSVPAFANFTKADLAQKVTVQDGQIVPLDFVAQPLGSISGKIIFGPGVRAPYRAGDGVFNAYVVAEPGEHAAIADEDGSFILDDMPPGTYTISVDPETVPENTGQTNPDITVTLTPHEHYRGAIFDVANEVKKVVLTFFGGGSASALQPTIDLLDRRLPPEGATTVSVDAPADALEVNIKAFGKTVALQYEKGRKAWIGTLDVPANTPAGNYAVTGSARGGLQPVDARLHIDPTIPLTIVQVSPPNPAIGEYVAVQVRFLADVRPGDKIYWQDGTVTTLGKPVSGRVFRFTLRISLRPLHGTLRSPAGSVPIQVL